MQLTELVAKYGGVAGTNAGGFNDENGRGNGGVPQGLVISGGALLHTAREGERYNVVGFDADQILHVGTMTADEALAQGLTDAVSFRTHDGLASSLIINGEVQSKNLGGGVNPRTAIGQCADGSVLLLVLDGRSINTLGATMQDVADIMLEYGAVNAGNLDGGSSSVMVYDGEIINNCASVTGPRNIPTAFIVLPEGGLSMEEKKTQVPSGTPESIAAPDDAAKRSRRRWRRFLVLYAVVWLLFASLVCAAFYKYLRVYEQALPEHVMDSLMETTAPETWLGYVKASIESESGEFDDAAALYEEYESVLLAGKKLFPTAARRRAARMRPNSLSAAAVWTCVPCRSAKSRTAISASAGISGRSAISRRAKRSAISAAPP